MSRRVLVSGGTSGLGLAAARRLAERGDRVWVMGSSASSVARALAEMPGAAGGSACDAADEPAVDAACAEAIAELGGLDAAFVNAGMVGERLPLHEIEVAQLRRVLDVNVLGAFLVARAAANALGAGGAILFNASVTAVRAAPGFGDYNASKAAVIAMARTLALDLAARQIAVNESAPASSRLA